MRTLTSQLWNRRQVLKSGVAAAALAGVGGLGFAGPAFGQTRPFEGQTITHWSFLSPEGKSARELAIRENEKTFHDNTGINVKFETYPWSELPRRVIAAAQAGTVPDVSRVPFESLRMVAEAGALTPLDAYIEKSFTKEERDDFIIDFSPELYVDGHKWNMQLEMIAHALFVRKDWLDEVGMASPKTWDDVVAFGKAVTNGNRWGYLYFAGKQMLVQTVFLQPHISGRGGKVLTPEGKSAFNSEAGAKAYQFLQDCVHKHKITPPDVVNMSWEDQTDAFRSGRAAMIIDGSHRYRDHVKAVGEGNVILVEIPSDDPNTPAKTPITGWGMGIPKGAGNPDAAWEYIKHYVSPEAQALTARIAGSLPSRRSAARDPFFSTPEAAYLRWWLEYAQAYSEPMINAPTANRLAEVMTNALQQVLLKTDSDISQVLDSTAAEYDRIVAQQR